MITRKKKKITGHTGKYLIFKIMALALIFILTLSLTASFFPEQAQAASPKKAIYILPGFMESRLFSKKFGGMDIWVGPGLLTEIGLDAIPGGKAEFVNNSSGVGMTAYADRKRDKNGLMFLFTPMITSLKTMLAANGLNNTYNVEFFSYNWLQDLNETAKELAADIKAKGYDNVILITHSNGALLASTFISQSDENKSKVEKAILLAPTLWGTHIALEAVETGGANLFWGAPASALIDLGYDLFIKPISKHWVKSWSRNAPNMYQLMASNEYVRNVPVIYRSSSGIQAINNPADYYNLLNKSPSINTNLSTGNARSLKYLRETVFKGDIINLWEGKDVTLMACEYGYITATSAIYHQSGTKAIYDGAIYSKAGDWVVPGISMKGDGRIPYINLPGAHHLTIFLDRRALHTINNIILGQSIPQYTAFESDITPTSSISPSVGMSDMIRVEIKSADPLEASLTNSCLSVNIYNTKRKLIARASGEAQMGFYENNFVYNSWDNSENNTNILCYIPKNGYYMEVLTGRAIRSASNITVLIETLDPSGAILSCDEYKLTGAEPLRGAIFTLDCSKSMKPAASFGAKLSTISAATYQQDWRFASDELTLMTGAASTPAISGTNASSMAMSDYNWSSSDSAVATVSTTGLITAKSPGTAIITALAKDNSYKIESLTVTVIPVSTFSVTFTTDITLPAMWL